MLMCAIKQGYIIHSITQATKFFGDRSSVFTSATAVFGIPRFDAINLRHQLNHQYIMSMYKYKYINTYI